MSTASLPWSQGRNEHWDRIASRLAHWTPFLWLLFLTSHIALVVLTAGRPLWTSIVGGLVIALIVLAILAAESWHMYAMCPVCARKIPLDPAAKVTQKRRRLSLVHWLSDRQKYINRTILVLFVLSLVPYANLAAFPLVILALAAIAYLGNVHLPLQPWCPYCRRWDEGGDHERAPTPDPTGAKTG